MSELNPDLRLEIAHVLFIDIVGSSKLLTNEQSELLRELNQIVRSTEQFRAAEAADKLTRLPSGDGMALVFFTSPDAPVRCALEISKALGDQPKLPLRMGIHSGPVDEVIDVNDRSNVAGAGITMAQRVMDCGDTGHILLSKRIADDLAQNSKWQPHLHDLGECEVKHGVRINIVNFYSDGIGNPATPEKFKRATQTSAAAPSTRSTNLRNPTLLAGALLAAIALAIGFWFFSQRAQRSTTASRVATPSVEKKIAVLHSSPCCPRIGTRCWNLEWRIA
jgi:class 3 adenylate cyclase